MRTLRSAKPSLSRFDSYPGLHINIFMKKLFIILLTLTSFPAFAANWTLLMTAPRGARYYMDYTTLLKSDSSGRQKSVWMKFQEPDGSYTNARWEFDCVSAQSRILVSFVYDPQGNKINEYKTPSNWEFIPPESRLEHWAQLVCR